MAARGGRARAGPRLTTRRGLLAAAALLASCGNAPRPGGGAGTPLPPVPLDGPLRSLGGFEIDARRLGAGSLSGIHLDGDLVATMVDDRSRWARARIVLRDGVAQALEPIASGPLGDGAGRPLPRGYAGDAEAITRLPDGTWLVAFERWHRIRAYRRLDGPGAYFEAPPGLDRAPANGGLESLTVLADGRLLAITEELQLPGRPELRRAWIGRPGAWLPIAWRPAPPYVPVDAAGLPDGGALVLERRFSFLGGFGARLVRVAPAAIAGVGREGVLEGEEVLRLDGAPLPAENWEGVAVAQHGGRTIVALVTDDNESALQRLLMLLFELQP
ncbi:esterase-like activity of phytase family protein [Neoroseomonas oryzicola]|uniref:Esterase-like activity of phytase family protein n=1 Tax=Neoroseomonas oryzicola TaxID=535904 RepID=A0A9X9WMT8_9PROT|nr:esterase-like activity of phytase family protein [Neoroseomonas oryzicola]NKE16895.1 esterase-like activity of phytase family protein [Neoroseomonas oryzicola]